MRDESIMQDRSTEGETLSIKQESANPTIPADPAGDYLYQDSAKPCESKDSNVLGVLLSNT